MSNKKCVYVIGAGFSAGLGYPLTSDLLVRLWDRIDADFKKKLCNVIGFHHPSFDPERFSTYPNVETLLSEMQVNKQLFHASRQYAGKFSKEDLINLETDLLLEITSWFHDISLNVQPSAPKVKWLEQFRNQVLKEEAAIISFNWDLILDELLFNNDVAPAAYGFPNVRSKRPILLKPHGSLNWFEASLGRHIKDEKRENIFTPKRDDSTNRDEIVYAFKAFRAPISKKGREYTPLIIPPVYLKNFEKEIFEVLWQNCVKVLSTARKVVFLGYSMPLADLHAQFILRSGFHNQVEGELGRSKNRKPPTGPAEVIIVNPDRSAAQRIVSVVGPNSNCKWVSTPVSEWVESEDRK